MAPKGKKADAAKQQKAGEEEQEKPLQAVILADPFEIRFRPFTLERPRCLLPLANTPLIEYTFEFLANAGVEEIYVYCGAHTEQVEEYIESSKWAAHKPSSPFWKLDVLKRADTHTVGDAMRDLDSKGVMTGDFLVVYGDVVSNIPLEPVLAAHRARRATDKNSIMTMVLREAGTNHRTKARAHKPVFVLNPNQDNRCLHFEQIDDSHYPHKNSLSLDHFMRKNLQIRQDLVDCGIDICTPDALALWSDNFDYQAPRRGYLHSILKDYDLNGKTIYAHILEDNYAARVRNLRAYDAVSRDILGRWTYPLVPDSNLLRGQSYRLQKGNIYREDSLVLTRTCEIRRNTVLGKGTSIGEHTEVSNSIIGRDCNIGKNVKIDGAYIWDNATIGDGTVVERAIVANEASVGRNCRVESGALISYGVVIADNTTVKGTSRITRFKSVGDQLERGKPDPKVVGERGDGFEFQDDEEERDLAETLVHSDLTEEDDDDDAASVVDESDLESIWSEEDHKMRTTGADSFTSIASTNSDTEQHAHDFHTDAAHSILDSLQKGDEASNIQLELTALRMSTNATEHQVRRAVVAAFMKRIAEVMELEKAGAKDAVDKVLKPYPGLLKRTMFDYDSDDKKDQADFLILMQQDLVHRKGGEDIMLHASMNLTLNDVVEAEGFEQWWNDERSESGEEMTKIRDKMRPMIETLLAESESESEEESGSEEE